MAEAIVAGGGGAARRAGDSLDAALVSATTFLRAHPDFASFDRLEFLASYAIPAAHQLDVVRRLVNVTPVRIPRFWRVDVASPFDAGAFNPAAFAPAGAPPANNALTALGRSLFFDPMLSGARDRSCATCHQPGRAFTDGLVRAKTVQGGAGLRNTPTVMNAGLQPAQFADERVVTLEEQAGEVLRNPVEMGSSVELAATRLNGNSAYRPAFARAFGDTGSAMVTAARVQFALAAYVRALVFLDSRFDRAVRGERTALTAEERRGFNVFMGKAACGTCHFAPLFSGVTPPLYQSSDVEVIGTPASARRPGVVDADSGRARIDRLPIHVRAFKTPTLRNIALTAPYMHNGALTTLDDVLDFYDKGGGAGAGALIADQTLSPQPLNLTAADRAALVAFMRALSDTAYKLGK